MSQAHSVALLRRVVLSCLCTVGSLVRHSFLRRRGLRRPAPLMAFLLAPPFAIVSIVVLFGGIPPNFSIVRQAERALLQHDWYLRERMRSRIGGYPLGGTFEEPKFLRFSDHIAGRGFSNVLQEYLVSYHLADRVNRTYVFEDHVLSNFPFPYTISHLSITPTRIPLSAFVSNSGFMDGATVPRSSERLPSVSSEYFEYVCPPTELFEIWYPPTEDELSSGVPIAPGEDAEWQEILDWFMERMEMDDVIGLTCVSIRETRKIMSDSRGIIDLFHDLKGSPVLQEFDWAPLVNDAVERTLQALSRSDFGGRSLAHPHPPHPNSDRSYPSVSGMLVVHVPRNGIEEHCKALLKRPSTYLDSNRLNSFPDTFEFPHFWNGSAIATTTQQHDGKNMPQISEQGWVERQAIYMPHCFPHITEIVNRLRRVKRDQEKRRAFEKAIQNSRQNYSLPTVYIITDGKVAWVRKLQEALLEDGWHTVSSSEDMKDRISELGGGDPFVSAGGDGDDLNGTKIRPFSREEKAVWEAIDMALAERAEVFVGSGFSGTAATIMTLRTARGSPMYSNHFL